MSGFFRTKVSIETEEGEVLAVDDFIVPDDMMQRRSEFNDRRQDAASRKILTVFTELYIEAAGK